MKATLDDLKAALTHMKSALQEPDTHAADFETVRRILERAAVLYDPEIKAARAALDRLEGRS